MSIEHLNLAFSMAMTGAKKAVLIALADRANKTGYCYPALDDIAFRAGCTKRTAINAVSELEKLGYLVVARDQGRLNKYILLLEKLSTARAAISPQKVIHSGETISPTSEINDQNQCNDFTLTIRTTTNQKERDFFKPENPDTKNQTNVQAYKFYQPEKTRPTSTLPLK